MRSASCGKRRVSGRDLAAGFNLVAENNGARDRLLAQHIHQRVRLRPPLQCKAQRGYDFQAMYGVPNLSQGPMR